MYKALIVDDMEINREILAEILQDEYSIVLAENGQQAIEILLEEEDNISVVLLDLVMPDMDGYQVLEEMNRYRWLDKIPVLVISAESALKVERRCFDLGVLDFIHKPFDSTLIRKRVENMVKLVAYKNRLEEKVERQTDTLKKQNEILRAQAKKLKESNTKMIDVLGAVVESRNLESGEHIKRVKGFTKILGEWLMKEKPEYGLTQAKLDIIVSAAALHDVGKIAIPDSILLKPGKLTKEEFEEMKTHTTRGCEILGNVEGVWDDEYGRYCYEICRYHHERYDGRGYPDGLAGEEIPVSAQIVGLADVYDALVSERVYKGAFREEEAFHMIQGGECGLFSPKILAGFTHVREAFKELALSQKNHAHCNT